MEVQIVKGHPAEIALYKVWQDLLAEIIEENQTIVTVDFLKVVELELANSGLLSPDWARPERDEAELKKRLSRVVREAAKRANGANGAGNHIEAE